MNNLILDGTKLQWYQEKVEAWNKGEKIAPVTVDMALTQACNYKCVYCYGQLQKNKGGVFTEKVISGFLEDAKKIGVKGISLVGDGESTCSGHLVHTLETGHKLKLAMALGTNGYLLDFDTLKSILPCLSYLRFNISAGEPRAYQRIMGAPKDGFKRVVQNINTAVILRDILCPKTTIGMQMVLMPEYADQILPLADLAIKLKVNYLIIKHCSDDEHKSLGVNYDNYKNAYPLLKAAQRRSNACTTIAVKWSKLRDGDSRSYQRCYGPPFILQISGSGLVAPCGMFFNDSYKRFHIGNITKQRFRDIWASDHYWEVMRFLASDKFDAQKMCGCLCLQHHVCKTLDDHKKGLVKLERPTGPEPLHKEFV